MWSTSTLLFARTISFVFMVANRTYRTIWYRSIKIDYKSIWRVVFCSISRFQPPSFRSFLLFRTVETSNIIFFLYAFFLLFSNENGRKTKIHWIRLDDWVRCGVVEWCASACYSRSSTNISDLFFIAIYWYLICVSANHQKNILIPRTHARAHSPVLTHKMHNCLFRLFILVSSFGILARCDIWYGFIR